MRMIRSLIYAGLALAAMAFTISAPAVAATDPGIYQSVKANVEMPAIIQVHEDTVAMACEVPATILTPAAGRSSVKPSSLNVALIPATVAAYMHIDPGRAGI